MAQMMHHANVYSVCMTSLFILLHAFISVTRHGVSATSFHDQTNKGPLSVQLGMQGQLTNRAGPPLQLQRQRRQRFFGNTNLHPFQILTRRFHIDDTKAFHVQYHNHEEEQQIVDNTKSSVLNFLESIPRCGGGGGGGGGEQEKSQSTRKRRRIQQHKKPKTKGTKSPSKKMKQIRFQEKDRDSIMIVKVRNILRSLLAMGEQHVPILAQWTRVIMGGLEYLTGISLLPSDAMDNSHKASTSRNKKSSSKQKTHTTQSSKIIKDKKKQQHSSQPTTSTTSSKTTTTTTGGGHAQSHLNKQLKTSNPNYRIQRELKEFLKSPPPNLSVKVGKNIRVWVITMIGTKGSLYEDETYRLRVQFPANYPTEPPSAYFLQPTPRHEHVYTNGDICLSLLGKDWRPNMTAQSIAMSILSILSGASRKSLPMDNAAHAQNKPGEKQDNWVYHDDNC